MKVILSVVIGIVSFAIGPSFTMAESWPYGIVDKTRGYSADFVFAAGAMTVAIPEADLSVIQRVIISTKDAYRPGWVVHYDGPPARTLSVNTVAPPFLLELLWTGSLPDGHGRIERLGAAQGPPTVPGGSTPQGTWALLPGLASDIGVGADGTAWVIGTDAVAGGFGIHRWTGSAWQKIDGGAVRIDVDPRGVPWVVNANGNIFRRDGGTWTLLPGLAKDIGIGADGTVWVIGTDAVAGGFGIYRWTGSAWQKIDGGAVRIDVGPSGQPWVVNSNGSIFRQDGSAWTHVAGVANDIGIGGDGTVWVIGADAMPGGYGVHRWTGSGWQKTDGAGTQISVGRNGTPWVVNSQNQIFHR